MSAPDPTRTGPGILPPDDATRSRPGVDPDVTWTHGSTPTVGPAVAPPGYEILGELGRGGMGIVYHVRHAKLNRSAALKTTHAGEKANPKDLIRFLAEAEAVAAVRHPHVVQVYDYGDFDGRPFLALELCPNGTLTDKLKAAGKLPPRIAAALVAKLAAAVQAAHEQGIVHRDLKPSNVLFDSVGEPKVTDFGLAKKTGGSDLTKTHAVMGTPAYMSPEQARGETKFVGPPADVWALGVVLYECLTGSRPFEADDSWALLQKVMNADPAPMPVELPRDLALITRTCLAKAPHERYPTAQALADDLGRFLTGQPISVRPAGVIERTTKWVKRNPFPAALVASLFVGTAAATTLAIYATREAARADQETENAHNSMVKEKDAAGRADAEAKTAKAKAAEAQRLLGLMAVNDGVRSQNQSDPVTALAYFARVLEVDPDNPAAVLAARERIANAIRYAPVPRLAHLLVVPEDERVVAAAADARRVVSVRANGTGRVWDVTTASPVCEFSVPNLNPETVTFSPRADVLFVTTRAPATIALIDAATGKPLPNPPVPDRADVVAEFSPDGSRLVLLDADEMHSVWNVSSGAAVIRPQHHIVLKCLDPISRNGTRMVFVDKSSARVHDLATGRLVDLVFAPDGTEIRRAAIAPAGDKLGLVFGDETVQLWDVNTGEPAGPAFPVDGVPTELTFFPSGDLLVVSSEGARRWDATTGEPRMSLTRTKDRITVFAVAPGGDWFAVADATGRVIVLAADDGSELTRTPANSAFINGLTISPDGLRVLPMTYGPVVTVWGPSHGLEGQDARPEVTHFRHEAPVRKALWTSDGRSLLTVSGTRVVRVWCESSAGFAHRPFIGPRPVLPRMPYATALTPFGIRFVWRTTLGTDVLGTPAGDRIGPPLGRDLVPTSARFTPDGRAVSAQIGKSRLRAWSSESGNPFGPILSTGEPLLDYSLSPDRSKWLTATEGGIRVWDVSTGRRLAGPFLPNGPDGPMHATHVQFAPDSNRFVALWSDGPAQLWDSVLGRAVWTSDAPPLYGPVRITPDGSTILGHQSDDRISVLSAETGQPAVAPLRHPGTAYLGTVSRDGRYALTGCEDNQARVWDLHTGRRVGPPIPAEFGSLPAEFSPDGRYVVTEPAPPFVRVYEVAIGQPATPPIAFRYGVDSITYLPTGDGILVGHASRHYSELSLRPDPRAADDLVRTCELLAAHQVDDTGSLVPLTPGGLIDRWTALSGKGYPELTDSRPDRIAWHAGQAAYVDAVENWYAAAFHYRSLVALDPGNPEWPRRLGHAEAGDETPELAPPPRRKGR